jgi:hypothetical protein
MINITKHDLIMLHIALEDNLVMIHKIRVIKSKMILPKKPSGKKIITIKITRAINFKEGFNRCMYEFLST